MFWFKLMIRFGLLVIFSVAVSACERRDATDTRGEDVMVDDLGRLRSLQGDPKEFQVALKEVIEKDRRGSLELLTRLTFELPFDSEDQESKVNVPIMMVERALDGLIFAESSHDHLSALYFRARAGRGDLGKAEKELLGWVLDNKDALVWNEKGYFELVE